MNTAWDALRLYNGGNRFLHIKGRITLNVAELEPALLKRAVGAIKRGFNTAQQGATHELLALVARSTGYNAHGFPYVSWNNVTMYFPEAAASEFMEVSSAIEALMHLNGGASTRYGAHRNDKELLFTQWAPHMGSEPRTLVRKFIKEQMLKWAIYRQPMLDFLMDPTRMIVWDFDSHYKGGTTNGGQ